MLDRVASVVYDADIPVAFLQDDGTDEAVPAIKLTAAHYITDVLAYTHN